MVQEKKDHETWKNNGQGRIFIKKFSSRGDVIDEMIHGGRTFIVTPEERRHNQEIAATTDLDVFSNGMLAPVRLLDTDDAAEIAANPNLMAESEMRELFKTKAAAFNARVAEIHNGRLLDRLIEVGRDVDATVKQMAALEQRRDEVSPRLFGEVTSSQVGERTERRFKPVTPR